MRTNRLALVFAAAVGLAAWSSAAFARPAPAPAAPVPPEAVAPRWSDLEPITYELRAKFFAGLARLEAKVDDQIKKLEARRAAMDGKVETRDWDFAMKEMLNARAYLKGMGDELRKADPETWEQKKKKVGVAWKRTQDAHDEVRSSTTS